MEWRKITWGALGLAVIVVTALVVKRLLVTDRDRVARAVGQLARHIERRDAASFCLLLDEEYTDSFGQNRAALRSSLAQGLPYFESISVRVQELVVEVRGDEAQAEFLAVVSARGRGRERPWPWETRARLIFRKRGDEWRVVHAQYSLPGLALDSLRSP